MLIEQSTMASGSSNIPATQATVILNVAMLSNVIAGYCSKQVPHPVPQVLLK